MKYNTEQLVKKIKAPIECRFGGEELSFADGTALAEHEFDKKYTVESVAIEGDKSVVFLNEFPMPDVNWTGEEEVTFF